MKTFFLASLAAAGIIAYLLNRQTLQKDTAPVKRTHHLTTAFSKAKQHAVNTDI